MVGIASSHPAACNALCNMFRAYRFAPTLVPSYSINIAQSKVSGGRTSTSSSGTLDLFSLLPLSLSCDPLNPMAP